MPPLNIQAVLRAGGDDVIHGATPSTDSSAETETTNFMATTGTAGSSCIALCDMDQRAR
jgi:hypothetical protein